MSFIDMGDEYNEVGESKPIPAGIHEVRVVDVKAANADDGTLKGLKVRLEATDVSPEELGYDPAPIMHYISIPNPALDNQNDQAKGNKEGTTTKMKQLMFKRFAAAFNVEMDGSRFEPNQLNGLSARVNVEHDEYEGNINARLRLPPLQE